MPNLIGQSLGRYRILEQLGEGGMATVYKAFDTRLERDVAVKIIRRAAFPPEQLDRILKRFEREAKALAKLSHPNIVGVIDFGDYEGSPYLVMEFLPSGTIKERLGRPIPWQEAARLLLPVARALQFAHKQGIVHRDIKPSNILITESGEPMLADFGIAKILESGEAATLTGTGVGVGTPEYMAPEQWTGTVTARSDIYSLGIVFYEMITGRKPYTADTPAAVMLKQATEPLPRPGQFVRNLPEGVERLLLKALARRPEDRYADMRAFADGMERLSAGVPIEKKIISSAQPAPSKEKIPMQSRTSGTPAEEATRDEVAEGPQGAHPLRAQESGIPRSDLRRWWMIGVPAGIGCICLTVLLGAGAVGLSSEGLRSAIGAMGKSITPTPTATALPATPIRTQEPTPTVTPIIAGMASLIIAELNNTGELAFTDINGRSLGKIQTGITGSMNLHWSPNGRFIIAVASSEDPLVAYLINIEEGAVLKWKEPLGSSSAWMEWSSASDRVSINDWSDGGWNLDIAAIDGSNRKTVYTGWTVNNTPYWSPEGKYLAFAGRQNGYSNRLYRIDPDTTEIKDITPQSVSDTGFGGNWVDENNMIIGAYLQGTWSWQILDIETGIISPLLSNSPSGQGGWPLLSPSKAKVAYSISPTNDAWDLYIEDRATGESDKIFHTDQAVYAYPVSWSPSEDYLLYQRQADNQGTDIQTFLYHNTTRNSIQLRGLLFFFRVIQRAEAYSRGDSWINDKQFIAMEWFSQNSYRFLLIDVSGNTVAELFNTQEHPGTACAIWVKS